jgi:hypothetical protein
MSVVLGAVTIGASSGDGQLMQRRPLGNELSCRRRPSRAEQDCVTAAARTRLAGIVAGRSIQVTDNCGWLGGRRHVGGECRSGAQHCHCSSRDHSNCLPATVAKACEVPDGAAHVKFPPRVFVIGCYRTLTQSHDTRFHNETQITTVT